MSINLEQKILIRYNMTNIKLNLQTVLPFVGESTLKNLEAAALSANALLHKQTGKGSDFLGWVNLPSSISETELSAIEKVANRLIANSEIVVVIGIGGSYLGSKAVLECLGDSFESFKTKHSHPQIVFAGHHLDEDYTYELLAALKGRKVSCIAISKSGTTTEPAVAFRIIKQFIEKEFGKEDAKNRIVAITDQSRGALKLTADKEGYDTFVIPDNVGGRYSVLTPVGLLPIAIGGHDIRLLLKGAADMEKASGLDVPFEKNICAQYAAARNALYTKGKKIEILANYSPKLHFFGEWWKQLFGESEGKDLKGIFPAGVDFTSDLHSMGQYIQEGERILFETVISIEKPHHTVTVPADTDNLDQLNFMQGRPLHQVNAMAELGTMLAHVDGGVPNIRIEIPVLNAHVLGELIYFFEKACGIGGYMLDVNPFDQPGVEAYKKNMFALLGKPGFEKEGEALRKRL